MAIPEFPLARLNSGMLKYADIAAHRPPSLFLMSSLPPQDARKSKNVTEPCLDVVRSFNKRLPQLAEIAEIDKEKRPHARSRTSERTGGRRSSPEGESIRRLRVPPRSARRAKSFS